MKSLQERIAFRAKQKRDNEMKAKEAGQDFGAKSKLQRNEEGKPGEVDENADFDSKGYLAQNVQSVSAGLKDLSVEQLRALEEAETNGGKRNGVLSAVKAELAKKQAAASGWTSQAG